ncbi:MAG: bifunctional hydroxymethylpyrimidine kinase/phosphomethylpyrimidine kinase [Methanomassiliicoccales archaeon]|nr:bifunctional hydroxymethylpyrimidine kinase/phosphomethylpyrimidine kinase [Methanomassiliicoccales archaeon]
MVVALSIAGSDPIGGAGIQADLKAFASLGVHGTTVITAITSQNTQRVSSILPVPEEHVLSQLEAILDDAKIDAAKTGMLYSGGIAKVVAKRLRRSNIPLVVDPVLVAGVGDSLHSANLLAVLKKELLPIASLATPNRSEAEELAGIKIRSAADARKACKRISELGAAAVLLKGGHFEGAEVRDVLFMDGGFTEIHGPRIDVQAHGAGCHLSSYITAHLANGVEMQEAVVLARGNIDDALSMSYSVGKGLKVVDSLATLKRDLLRYPVLVALDEAVAMLEGMLRREWVPEVGINFAYALPRARYHEDVCAIKGRIVGFGDVARHVGCLGFGASRHVARIVLAAMHFDPSMRSALNLRYSEENLSKLMACGLDIASFERRNEPKGVSTMEWGTAMAIKKAGKMPDAIFDRGGIGKEPMIRVLGHDPFEVIEKISPALQLR